VLHSPTRKRIFGRLSAGLVLFLSLVQFHDLPAETAYDCNTKESRDNPTTVEIVLSQKWKDQTEEIKKLFAAEADAVKVRIKFFPFLEPPANIGIGKCVTAESARLAIGAARKYSGKLDWLIFQDILPHHWIKIGSTDLPELTWTRISPEDLEHLTDPALTTEQFQILYRRLATPAERKKPFGLGREESPKQDPAAVEILSHKWHPDTVWERIGKTKFVWEATVRNNSTDRIRVFVYYDLLDANDFPLARNVANKFIEPHQTAEIISDSYIMTADLPQVKNSRVTLKVGPTH